MDNTLEEAIEFSFEDYMAWCHEYCRGKAKTDPIFKDVILNAPFAILESGWARRYWFHHCGKLKEKNG